MAEDRALKGWMVSIQVGLGLEHYAVAEDNPAQGCASEPHFPLDRARPTYAINHAINRGRARLDLQLINQDLWRSRQGRKAMRKTDSGDRCFGGDDSSVPSANRRSFLNFSKSRGNDLSTPMAELGFPGLKPGDRWCLCASRWQEAFEAGQAPRVVLRATLAHCSLADLKRHAVDLA
jgi:uncharacterized protein (DUF2237 family)